ncbi:hypothetical protein QYM36_010407 [Artemia franciscana]|uniref:Uncharacterized protein n=1 Tax=Artemia franciscana TaxID=6661 RepID=A0AA88LC06_ARTSF|nr:hypothetical protein QYM36_010407 [Artemia franciscana]
MPRKQDPVNKEWLHKKIIVNSNPVNKAFCKHYGCSLVKNTCRLKYHLALCEKAPIEIREYYNVQKSSIHKKFAAVTKKCMKEESRERGNSADSEDVSTDSNSSDEDCSNQETVPFLPVSKAEERKIHRYLENRMIFAYDPTLAAAILLAPLFGANPLTQDEFTDAISRINELAKFSY